MNSYFRAKVKVVSDLSNYGTKTELEHDTGIDTFDLTAVRDFIALKAYVDKADISKLTSVPTKTMGKISEAVPVFMWNTALRGNFNLFSSWVFSYHWQNLYFATKTGH